MSEWHNNQKKPSSDFRKLLQERIEKSNSRRTLTAEEERRLSKPDRLIIDGAQKNTPPDELIGLISSIYSRDFFALEFVTSERRETYLKMLKLLDSLSNDLNITVLDRMSYVCSTDVCELVGPDLGKYFFDMGHHTLLGAKYFGQKIDQNSFADLL